MPAVISTPPCSRSRLISSSYWPRKRKPCERTTWSLDLILLPSQVVYPGLSLAHISHWLALSSKASSRTMVMQSLAGHTASHTPQPQHDSMLASYRPSGVTSKQVSGLLFQQSVHFTHLSSFPTRRALGRDGGYERVPAAP